MANPPPGVPVEKKRGFGCWGCGCIILAIIVLLVGALVVGAGYMINSEAVSMTSATPGNVPSFTGTDDVYQTAKQKFDGFTHDLRNHQAATISLSGDEINALISRDPDFTGNKIHLFVTLSNDQARVQFSLPTNIVLRGYWLKDRYCNGESTFGVNFDPAAKMLNLQLQSAQTGETPVPEADLPAIQTEVNQVLNQMMQKDPDGSNLLQHAKSIQIKNGQLVIETE